MPTLFEKMWTGEVPALHVYRSHQLGVMAVLAEPQETRGQMVVFPVRPEPRWYRLNHNERDDLDLVTATLMDRAETTLGAELVASHVEGRGVSGHAHIVIIPSYERGDTDRIHHPSERLPFDEFAEQNRELQRQLSLPESVVLAALAARREERQWSN